MGFFCCASCGVRTRRWLQMALCWDSSGDSLPVFSCLFKVRVMPYRRCTSMRLTTGSMCCASTIIDPCSLPHPLPHSIAFPPLPHPPPLLLPLQPLWGLDNYRAKRSTRVTIAMLLASMITYDTPRTRCVLIDTQSCGLDVSRCVCHLRAWMQVHLCGSGGVSLGSLGSHQRGHGGRW
jgi:hypothetical protein